MTKQHKKVQKKILHMRGYHWQAVLNLISSHSQYYIVHNTQFNPLIHNSYVTCRTSSRFLVRYGFSPAWVGMTDLYAIFMKFNKDIHYICSCYFYILNVQYCQIWFLLRTRPNKKGRLNAQKVVLKQEKKINTQINHYVSGDRIKIFVFEQLLQEGSHRRSRELKS